MHGEVFAGNTNVQYNSRRHKTIKFFNRLKLQSETNRLRSGDEGGRTKIITGWDSELYCPVDT